MTAVISGTNGLLQSYDYQVPTTGFTYTFAAGTQVLVMNPAGTLATGTITMPASPADGMTITFSSSKQITTLTMAGNGANINTSISSLDAGQSVSYIYRATGTTWFPFTTAVPAYDGLAATAYTSNATFTIPTGITKLKVTVVGGGGAGGVNGTTGGGGGGGGGTAITYLTGLTPGNTLAVTVGAAGSASTVASGTQTISTITGGAGSVGNTNGGGGAGGAASGGTLNIPGGTGGTSDPVSGVGQFSGFGGSTFFAQSVSNTTANQPTGSAGTGYGGGGAGGVTTGGAGAAGVVVFEY